MALFRDGFARDYALIILLTILLGSATAFSVSHLIGNGFSGAVTGLLGEHGEFDVIVHVQQEYVDPAATEIHSIVKAKLPHARVKQGLTVAGKANFFIDLPSNLQTQATFEALHVLFEGVLGYAGRTIVAAPSVVVRQVHPAVREEIVRQADALNGVRAAFVDGQDVYVLLQTAQASESVSDALNHLLAQRQIVEIRLPMGFSLADPQRVGPRIAASLMADGLAVSARPITDTESTETGAFVNTLQKMKEFLLSYAATVEIVPKPGVTLHVGDRVALPGLAVGYADPQATLAQGPLPEQAAIAEITEVHDGIGVGLIVRGDVPPPLENGAIVQEASEVKGDHVGKHIGRATVINQRAKLLRSVDESLRLLEELQLLVGQADATAGTAEQALTAFEQVLEQLDLLQQQMGQLSAPDGSTGGDKWLSVLLSTLAKRLLGAEQFSATQKNGEMAALNDALRRLADQVQSLRTVDFEVIARQIEHVRNNLPQLKDEEIAQSLTLIDRYLQGTVIPGDRVVLLTDASFAAQKHLDRLRQLVGNEYATVLSTSIGTVTPDSRTTVMALLAQVQKAIAALVAFVVMLLSLFFDHATVFAALRQVSTRQTRRVGAQPLWRRLLMPLGPGPMFGAAVGAGLLVPMVLLSGATLPGVGHLQVAAVGAFLGALTAWLAPRISPVNGDEIVAGESLGLRYRHVMLDIVAPAGRPGLLALLAWLQRWERRNPSGRTAPEGLRP